MGPPTSNPYSPPDDSIALSDRTSTRAAGFLVAVLALVLSLRGFRAMVYLGVLSPWEVVRDAVTWLTPETLGVSWAATRPFLVFAFVSFGVWIYHANRDARALGASDMSFSPGWAAAIGFIPIVNLIGPYRAVKEIYQVSSWQSSARASTWREQTVPVLLPLWWGAWIASLAWNLVPFATLTSSSAVWGQAIVEVLRAAAAFMLILVVREIERCQSRRGLSPAAPHRA